MGRRDKKRDKNTKDTTESNADISNYIEEENCDVADKSNNINDVNFSNKRPLDESEGDSDAETKPKKPKKKKKRAVPSEETETTSKKNKKSIRQMKKEKFIQRQTEAAAAAKDQLKSQCLNYLSQWKHDRQNWKFMKAKQVWLYKNKFSKLLIPETSWPLLLEYFESAQGNIRKMLLDDANKIIKQMDEWTESQVNNEKDNENEEVEESDHAKPDDVIYNRARSLIQCLQE
ncbi:uncharacterized protein C7orf50 homolog [Zerene cesonia]|uniref:uncharacterized protein C7orf50 homolog n=1 Tax=Zerene cesonia TaxID=33412 RepID=UPI0018E58055|nr:uncharacterized protein C7orf50 homolog [Zerene cesonia]